MDDSNAQPLLYERELIEANRDLYMLALTGDETSAAAVVRTHGLRAEAVVWSALQKDERRLLRLLGELRDNFGPRFSVEPDDDDDAAALHGLHGFGLVEHGPDGWAISSAGHQLYGGQHA